MGLFGPPNIEKLKARKDITGLIKALGYKKDQHVRISAAHALGEIGDPLAVEPLIDFLWDERSTAESAIYALGSIRDRYAVDPLVQFINREMEDEPFIGSHSRRNIEKAISTLGLFGGDSVDPLISLFPGAKKFRQQIIIALAKTETKQALEWLINAYQDWPEARKSIVIALGNSGDALTVETVIKALKNPDYDLSSTAGRALDALNWKPDNLEAGAHYWVAKGEWSKAVKYGPLAVEPLINVLWDDGNDSTAREAAAIALGQIGLPSLEPLIRTISQGNSRYQPVARRLGMGNVWSFPDMRPRVLDYCVEALVLIGKQSVESLQANLNHKSEIVHRVVAEALKKIS